MLSFNKVYVTRGDKAGNQYTPQEFINLPLSDRIKMVIEDQITFYNNYNEVDKVTSLNELRKNTSKMVTST